MYKLNNILYLILFLLFSNLFAEDFKVQKVGTLNESFYEVAVKNHIVYGASNRGIVVFDASDPKDMKQKSVFSLNDEVNSIYSDGKTLYIGGKKGLYIWDVSDITSPKQLSFLASDKEIKGMDVKESYIYAVDGEGLKVIDIYDKTSPNVVTSFTTSGVSEDVKVRDDKAYIADGENGLVVLQIAHSGAITEIGSYESNSTADKIAVVNNEAYISYGAAGFRVIDISDPSNPSLLFDCDGPSHYCHAMDIDISSDGKTSYILDKTTGLKVANVITPDNIHLASEYKQLGEAVAMAREGDLVYIANKDTGIQVIDVSDKFHAKRAGSHECVFHPKKAVAKGDTIYIADVYGGLDIVDFSDTSSLKVTGNIELGCIAESIDVSKDEKYVYITDFCQGLHIVDISDKQNPKMISTLITEGRAYDVKVKGDYVYIADRSKGLQTVDIKDPKNPSITANTPTEAYAMGVYVKDNYAYLADYNDTLCVIDISDPKNPVKTGTYDTDTSGYAMDVVNSGDYTYIANFSIGLQIVDTKNPNDPKLSSVFDLNSSTSADHATGVDVKNSYAYLAYKDFGFAIVDISDKEHPSLFKHFAANKSVEDVSVIRDYIISCDDGYGIDIYKMSFAKQIEDFIKRLYTKLLKRDYDEEGLNYYLQRLLNDDSAASVAEVFFQSAEFRGFHLSTDEFLQRTYETLLDRTADNEGLLYWKSMIDDKGIPRDIIFYKFIMSDEFKSLALKYNIKAYSKDDALRAFLNRMYLLVLDRNADLEGVNFWAGKLKSGEKTAQDIAMEFFGSKEFIDRHLSDAEFIDIAYRALMDREADEGGKSYWRDFLKTHGRLDMVKEFVSSEEFQNLSYEYGVANK